MTKKTYLCLWGILVALLTSINPVPAVASIEVPDKPFVDLKKQLACVAKAVYHEARGEGIAGMAAVAKVVKNRVEHGFADTPCDVVYQATITKTAKLCQFSWVCTKKADPAAQNPQYIQAQQVAHDVLVNGAHDNVVPDSAVFFHNTQVAMAGKRPVARVGNHVFYGQARKKR